MGIFQNKKSALEKELEILQKKEAKFLKCREEKKDSLLNQKLAEKVPAKLQETLDSAFYKAFMLIFDKGTGIIEKTYRREEKEKNYKINEYADEIRQSRKSLRVFSKNAKSTKNVNMLLSGASGIGMGVLGIGFPDIPLFTGFILKGIYEIALSYGYEYDSEQERYFILLLIQTAVSNGEDMIVLNAKVDRYIVEEALLDGYNRDVQIQDTAASLSKELLYMKFLQGIPVVGVVGGAYDAIYMKRITEYAELKYRRRFLNGKANKNSEM